MTPDKYDDVIDSREIIERIAELRSELEADQNDIPALSEEETDAYLAELDVLERLAEQGESADDWQHGETLIRDSYFEAYAMELAEEIGAINPDASWPANCIDWGQAARELRMDYWSVDFDGVTYWLR